MQASGFVAVYECKYGKPGRQRVAVMSPLLRVFSGKLIGMAQYHLPRSVFAPIDLGAAQCPRHWLITRMPGHVLQVDGVCEVMPDDRDDVFGNPFCRFDAPGSPVKPLADLLPAALVTAEGAHDHDVVGVRPQGLERFCPTLHQVTQCVLALGDETFPVTIHGADHAKNQSRTATAAAALLLAVARKQPKPLVPVPG